MRPKAPTLHLYSIVGRNLSLLFKEFTMYGTLDTYTYLFISKPSKQIHRISKELDIYIVYLDSGMSINE
jgi:hypothetical protein